MNQILWNPMNMNYNNNMNNNMMNMNMNYNNNMNNNMNGNMINNNMMNNNYNNINNINNIMMNMNNMNNMNNNIMNMNYNNINNNMNNMNFNNNMNNYNINGFAQKNNVEDPLYYIHEPKIILKFTNIDTIKEGKFIMVKIPISITKSDLYSIDRHYQKFYLSKIILTYNNYLLKEDESSIEGIPEGSVINIIEDVDYPDDFYYDKIMKKYENSEKDNIGFDFPSGVRKVLTLPKNIPIDEIKKSIFSKLSIYIYKYFYDFERSYQSGFRHFKIVQLFGCCEHTDFGKIITYKFLYKTAQFILQIGLLNSIKNLIKRIQNTINDQNLENKLKCIYIGRIKYENNEEKSLASLGIIGDFECRLEFENNNLILIMNVKKTHHNN